MHVGTRGTCLTHNVLSLKQTENTGGATSNTCCLNARVFWAREARWRLHSSGMTSLRHVWGLSMRRRCCLRHFLLIVPLLWLPRLVSSRSSSTLLLPWDVPPPLAHEVAVRVTSRGVLAWCVGCGVHGAVSVGVGVGRPSPSCLVVRPFVVALPTVWSFVCAGAASCAYSCSAHVRPCAQGRCGRCPPGSGVMSDFLIFYFFHSVASPFHSFVPTYNVGAVGFIWDPCRTPIQHKSSYPDQHYLR